MLVQQSLLPLKMLVALLNVQYKNIEFVEQKCSSSKLYMIPLNMALCNIYMQSMNHKINGSRGTVIQNVPNQKSIIDHTFGNILDNDYEKLAS